MSFSAEHWTKPKGNPLLWTSSASGQLRMMMMRSRGPSVECSGFHKTHPWGGVWSEADRDTSNPRGWSTAGKDESSVLRVQSRERPARWPSQPAVCGSDREEGASPPESGARRGGAPGPDSSERERESRRAEEAAKGNGTVCIHVWATGKPRGPRQSGGGSPPLRQRVVAERARDQRHPALGRCAAWDHASRTVSDGENLVDPASSHMLRSRAKPCMSQCTRCTSGSVNGSLHQQSSE